MKQLQSNFTTPEQSKRLLELGVPADSADCYNTTKHTGKIRDGETYKDVLQMSKWRNENGNHIEMYPCWSVGRLIEIYLLCAELKKPQMIFIKEDVLMMDRMINELCYMAESERLDLSKLEE